MEVFDLVLKLRSKVKDNIFFSEVWRLLFDSFMLFYAKSDGRILMNEKFSVKHLNFNQNN